MQVQLLQMIRIVNHNCMILMTHILISINYISEVIITFHKNHQNLIFKMIYPP